LSSPCLRAKDQIRVVVCYLGRLEVQREACENDWLSFRYRTVGLSASSKKTCQAVCTRTAMRRQVAPCPRTI